MKLDLDRIPLGASNLALAGDFELCGPEDMPIDVQVQGALEIQNLESRVLVVGQLQASCEVACSRCLESFQLVWRSELSCMVLRDVMSQEGRDESLVIHQRQGEVDLTEVIRECTLLGFPQAPVCNPECLGLCSSCGKNLNNEACNCEAEDHDPRWDALP